jgi:hypothetical protein
VGFTASISLAAQRQKGPHKKNSNHPLFNRLAVLETSRRCDGLVAVGLKQLDNLLANPVTRENT